MKYHYHLCSFIIAALCSSGVLLADTPSKSGTSSKEMSSKTADISFVKKAAQDGAAEVQLGKLAKEKATHPEVKTFADRLVQDHSEANQKLQEVASTKQLSLPSTPSAEQKQHYAQLEKLSGEQFDRAFIEHMLKDHKNGINAFEQEVKSGKDDEFKEFAGATLPKLKEHLQIAQNLSEKVGSKGEPHAMNLTDRKMQSR